jgi:hypothetical protein
MKTGPSRNSTKRLPILKQMAVERLPTEVDNEIELIDLSNLTSITPEEDAAISSLNYRFVPKHPVAWEINGSGGSHKMYADGSIEFNEKGSGEYYPIYPKCNTPTRPRTTHTQIISLLTQNNSGPNRPANFFFWKPQPDEGYYISKAKEGLAEFIAATRPNYFCVPEDSSERWWFKCPELEKFLAAVAKTRESSIESDDGTELEPEPYDNVDYGCGTGVGLAPPRVHRGDILIHVAPKTGQATYVCPRCTYNNKKIFGGTGHPVKHPIDRDLRKRLEEDGIIPVKEYKYKDRTAEVDAIIDVVNMNPRGISYYKIDQGFAWPKGTAERLVKKYLKDRVIIKEKNGKTRVCPIKNRDT